ncbi:flavin reductase family protein [Ravibacter arvi]|uniref:Flavin reductase family protein n=1 Tax=Ravibacter arvi TaxID=2051041 RepID=A0ABP8M1D6_9BACT
MKSVDPAKTESRAFYRYMVNSVAPRPIALVSTIDNESRVNLSPFSFFNYMGIDPPILAFAPNRRSGDSSEKDTILNLKEIPEAVVNLVDADMVQQVSLASSVYDRGVNEFQKAGFTALPASLVRPPRVAESLIQLECRTLEIIEKGTMSLVVAEVVMAHFSEKILDSKGQIDPLKTSWVGRSGGNWYNLSDKNTLFEVPRPVLGIGIDALPLSVQRSAILTGNDLGMLGSLQLYPAADAVKQYRFDPIVQELRNQTNGVCENFNELLHIRVKELLAAGNVEEALLAALQSH